MIEHVYNTILTISSTRVQPLVPPSKKKSFRQNQRECYKMAANSICSSLSVHSMANKKPSPSATRTITSKKGTTSGQVKLLTRVEQLKLLTKAEKAGLLSLAEKSGFSLSTIERLGLLTKAEEFGVLSAATNPETPGTLFTLSLGLLLLGPVFVYLVPEDYSWQVVAQLVVALVSVLGGSAAFAASGFVSNLQKSD